jgi:hypothetical protein
MTTRASTGTTPANWTERFLASYRPPSSTPQRGPRVGERERPDETPSRQPPRSGRPSSLPAWRVSPPARRLPGTVDCRDHRPAQQDPTVCAVQAMGAPSEGRTEPLRSPFGAPCGAPRSGFNKWKTAEWRPGPILGASHRRSLASIQEKTRVPRKGVRRLARRRISTFANTRRVVDVVSGAENAVQKTYTAHTSGGSLDQIVNQLNALAERSGAGERRATRSDERRR